MKTSRWLYRLQQHLAITRGESTVILTLTLLLVLGLGVRGIQQNRRPLPPDTYREADRLFEQHAQRPAAALAPAETLATDMPGGTPPAPTGMARININTASVAQLQRLPRIGPKTAQRILAYREVHGGFRRVEELLRVRGIGPKTLAGLQEQVTTGE